MKAITPKLSAKTMTTYFGAAQMVIASAKKNGNQLFPRTWDLHCIGLPRVKAAEQNTPSFDPTKIEAILAQSKGQFLVLGALLASTGLRIREALGLKVEHIINDRSTVVVEQSLWRGEIQAPKTVAANRQIDICDELAIVLHKHIGDRTEGFLFSTKHGKPLNTRNVERDWLDPIMEDLKIKETGLLFHSFRRFRTVHLRKNRVPWDLEKFWIGHASKDITDRYSKSSTDDLAWRKQVAQQTGLGFSIPVGQPGQLVVEEIALEVGA